MRFCTRARYGARAMLDLAIHYQGGPVAISEVARRQEIPKDYLENVMVPLRVSGLVRAERGSHGGYVLARAPAEITLGEIVRVLEGSLAPAPCLDAPASCSRFSACVLQTVYAKAQKAMTEVLEAATLADLVTMQVNRGPGLKEG